MYVPPGDSLSSFPFKDFNTINMGILDIFAYGSIAVIGLILKSKKQRNYDFDLFNLIFLNAISISTTGVFVNIMKTYVGRPRPTLYSRCGQDSNYKSCKNLSHFKLNDMFASWPSGHASTAMSSSMFIILFLLKLQKTSSFEYMIYCLIILFISFFVGITRISDHWHHPDDVLAGFFVGYVVTKIVWKSTYKLIFCYPVTKESSIKTTINK